MICAFCDREPAFFCSCSQIHLCSFHIGEHLMTKGSHPYQHLHATLDYFEKYLLNKELNERISQLRELKVELKLKIEKIISDIESIQSKMIGDINKIIKDYREILSKKEFPVSDIEDIRYLMKSEAILNLPDSSILESEINKLQSEGFVSFEHDPLKETIYTQKLFLQSHNGGFTSFAISLDGNIIVTGSNDTTVRVWDIVRIKQIACYAEHTDTVGAVALKKDCSSVISGSEDQRVMLWDLRNNCLTRQYCGHSGGIETVAFSLDEEMIISCSKYEIVVWDYESANILNKISESSIYCLLVISENRLLLGSWKRLEIWNLIANTKNHFIEAHQDFINSIATTKDYKFIVTCSDDHSVKVWEADSMRLYTFHEEHTERVNSISLTPDDQNLISGSNDLTLIIWNINQKSTIHKFTFSSFIWSVGCMNDKIISASGGGIISISRLSSLQFESYLSLKSFEYYYGFYINKNLVAYREFNKFKILDVSNNNEIILEGHSDEVNSCCFSSDNSFFVSTSDGYENNLIVWDLKEKSIKAILNGHNVPVYCVDVSSDDSNALSGDFDSNVIYWDLSNFSQVFVFNGPKGGVNSVKISKNKSLAISGSFDQVIIWNIARNFIHASIDLGLNHSFKKIVITNDDKYLVFGNSNDGIYVWDLENKRQEHQFSNLSDSKQWLGKIKELKSDCYKIFSHYLI